uniref:Uncharacterized protein n=1 Tax=Mustela putorius furo TaxID=9669 RepID=M3YZZ3_MUSPF
MTYNVHVFSREKIVLVLLVRGRHGKNLLHKRVSSLWIGCPSGTGATPEPHLSPCRVDAQTRFDNGRHAMRNPRPHEEATGRCSGQQFSPQPQLTPCSSSRHGVLCRLKPLGCHH